LYKLYRTGVDFPISSDLNIPPYILGIWLGDGHSKIAALTTMDNVIKKEWCEWGKSLRLNINTYNLPNNQAKTYSLVRKDKKLKNPVYTLLKKYNLLGNKHIPYTFKTASKYSRLQLLAGLIDTDGSKSSKSTYEIIQKNKQLANDILYLCRSLGLAAYKTLKKIDMSKFPRGGYNKGEYWRISISGNLSKVPIKIKRKQCEGRSQKKDPLVTSFKIKFKPKANYYGFSITKDSLYLLDDFTVTHNTGKTKTACRMIWDLGVKTLVVTPGKSISQLMVDELTKHFGKGKVVKLTTKSEETKPINIVNIQALVNLPPKLFEDMEAVIIDEFHHAAADTYLQANEEHLKNCFYRIGLTATNFRNDGADMGLEAVLSNVLYEYEIKQAIDDGYLMKPEFEILDISLNQETTYRKAYSNCIVKCENRNSLISEIAKEHRKDHVLILVKEIKHGETLQEMIPNSHFIHGTLKDVKRNRLMRDYRSGKIKCLIGTSVIGEGVDLPIANVLIMAGGGKARSQVMQNIGRVLRIYDGKDFALVYDFSDEDGAWLEDHAEARFNIYELY